MCVAGRAHMRIVDALASRHRRCEPAAAASGIEMPARLVASKGDRGAAAIVRWRALSRYGRDDGHAHDSHVRGAPSMAAADSGFFYWRWLLAIGRWLIGLSSTISASAPRLDNEKFAL